MGLLSYVGIWYRAIRPFTLSAALVPVLVGSTLATQYGAWHWELFLLALLASVLVQCGTNLTDEYADHRPGRGGEHKVQAPYKVIALGLLTPAAVRQVALTCFALAALIGLYLVTRTGWPLALVCLASVGVAYGYSAGPLPLGNIGLGEPLVFLFMGPVMVLGSLYIQIHTLTWAAVWVSLPVACLVTAILVVNNLRDAEEDHHSGKQTLVALWGAQRVSRLFALLVWVAFCTLPVLAFLGAISWVGVLLCLLVFPQGRQLMVLVQPMRERAVLHQALRGTAQLHLRFGLLLALAVSPVMAWWRL
ncbi:MAG: 1,4-dihydroxy-2-naphthoate octaprenyltransferase [Candidatus Tectomicrobia bacterium]|uniref:1,4-dihydroxy-2-naphthoate octaprenyltransferase n=1 Tax=Tectimicrobiota bacterium TaxID=2528274 RepID=A0A937VYB9_UNCTE|nr:1,4-dihydroxy-2-naphthoate octaprenyltransferase [Candidatus Tectomicrobia bacterium]